MSARRVARADTTSAALPPSAMRPERAARSYAALADSLVPHRETQPVSTRSRGIDVRSDDRRTRPFARHPRVQRGGSAPCHAPGGRPLRSRVTVSRSRCCSSTTARARSRRSCMLEDFARDARLRARAAQRDEPRQGLLGDARHAGGARPPSRVHRRRSRVSARPGPSHRRRARERRGRRDRLPRAARVAVPHEPELLPLPLHAAPDEPRVQPRGADLPAAGHPRHAGGAQGIHRRRRRSSASAARRSRASASTSSASTSRSSTASRSSRRR